MTHLHQTIEEGVKGLLAYLKSGGKTYYVRGAEMHIHDEMSTWLRTFADRVSNATILYEGDKLVNEGIARGRAAERAEILAALDADRENFELTDPVPIYDDGCRDTRDHLRTLIASRSQPEEARGCEGNCPNVCKPHGGEYEYCINAGCKCRHL